MQIKEPLFNRSHPKLIFVNRISPLWKMVYLLFNHHKNSVDPQSVIWTVASELVSSQLVPNQFLTSFSVSMCTHLQFVFNMLEWDFSKMQFWSRQSPVGNSSVVTHVLQNEVQNPLHGKHGPGYLPHPPSLVLMYPVLKPDFASCSSLNSCCPFWNTPSHLPSYLSGISLPLCYIWLVPTQPSKRALKGE